MADDVNIFLKISSKLLNSFKEHRAQRTVFVIEDIFVNSLWEVKVASN